MRTPDNLGLSYGVGTFTDPQIQWEVDLSDDYPDAFSFRYVHTPVDLNDDGTMDILTTVSVKTSRTSNQGRQVILGMDGRQGAILWQVEFGDTHPGFETPVVGDVDGDGSREIIIGSGQRLFCMSTLNGSVEWSLELDRDWVDVVEPLLIWNRTTLRYDIAYANPHGNVSKIDGRNGNVLSRIILREVIGDGVVIDSPLLGFQSSDNDALNILVTIRYGNTGAMCVLNSEFEIIWREEFPKYHPTGISAIDGQEHGSPRIVFNSWESYQDEDHIVVLDATNGQEIWNRSLDYLPVGNGVARTFIDDVDGDGGTEYILMNSPSDTLYVYDRNGTLEWSQEVSCVDIGAVCDIDSNRIDELLITLNDGELVCLSGPTGELRWSLDLDEDLNDYILACDIDGDKKIELIIGSYNGLIICIKGNADENFIPVLTVGSPMNNSVLTEWVTISGSVIDLDDEDEDITIELKVDDDEWKTLGKGSHFEFKIRIEETSRTERVLRLRATDGKATSNIVRRELTQDINVSTPPVSLIYLVFILVLVILFLVYRFTRHT